MDTEAVSARRRDHRGAATVVPSHVESLAGGQQPLGWQLTPGQGQRSSLRKGLPSLSETLACLEGGPPWGWTAWAQPCSSRSSRSPTVTCCVRCGPGRGSAGHTATQYGPLGTRSHAAGPGFRRNLIDPGANQGLGVPRGAWAGRQLDPSERVCLVVS